MQGFTARSAAGYSATRTSNSVPKKCAGLLDQSLSVRGQKSASPPDDCIDGSPDIAARSSSDRWPNDGESAGRQMDGNQPESIATSNRSSPTAERTVDEAGRSIAVTKPGQ